MWVRPIERRAGGAQAGDGGASAARRRRVAQDRRAGGGGLAGDVEQILDRDRQAGERRQGSRPAPTARSAAAAAARAAAKAGRDEGGRRRAPPRRRRSTARSARRPRRRAPTSLPARFGQVVGHRECYNFALCLERTSCPAASLHGEARRVGRGSRSIREPAVQGVAASNRTADPRLRFEPDSRTNLWKLDDDHDA